MEEEIINSRIAEFRRKIESVDYNINLPDTEFEIMTAIWDSELPVTSRKLMESMGEKKGWRIATLISFLVRLEDRGFIMSYKDGKERSYVPVADRDMYTAAVTERFCERVHSGSFVNMLESLFFEKNLSDDDIDSIIDWLKSRYE